MLVVMLLAHGACFLLWLGFTVIRVISEWMRLEHGCNTRTFVAGIRGKHLTLDQ